MSKMLEITLRKSPIGRPGKHKAVLKGLGLTRLNKTVLRKDTPEIRGMIFKVNYMLEVKELGEGAE